MRMSCYAGLGAGSSRGRIEMSERQVIKNSQIGKNPTIWNWVNIVDSKIGDNAKIASFVEIIDSEIGND